MDLQREVQTEESKQEWVSPELLKMDVSSGTLNGFSTASDGFAQQSSS